MRTKILLLPVGDAGETVCGYAERLLTEISASFNHVFSLVPGKIGDLSVQTADALPDSLLDACQDCSAVFLSDARWQGAQALYDGLALPLCIRSFAVSPALCEVREAPRSLAVGTVLSLDQDTVHMAMASAFRFSQEQETRLSYVAPSGNTKADWDQAAQLQQLCRPALSAAALSAPEAISRLITVPDQMGLLLCPPYAGAMMTAAGDALCAHPSAVHDLAYDDELGVYAPCLTDTDDGAPDPLSTALAITVPPDAYFPALA